MREPIDKKSIRFHYAHMTNVRYVIKLQMQKIAGSRILSGAIRGQDAFVRMVKETGDNPVVPSPVFLDFKGVEVATSSYLRETVLAYRDFIRSRRPAMYPVVANLNEVVKEELAMLVQPRGDVLMACKIDDRGNASALELIGALDPKQSLTFKLVLERGEVDAAALMRDFGKQEKLTHATAWNNRLSSLASLGLIAEVSYGRTKKYRPVLPEEHK